MQPTLQFVDTAHELVQRLETGQLNWITLSALLFLYRVLLERDLDLEGVVRARQKRRLPVVLTPGGRCGRYFL